MASVGEILRRERERQGLTLAHIAEQTRIRLSYLESLERDDFSSLPGKFFARSFTTQYAEKLGLNTPELQAALQRQVAPPEIFTPDQSTNPGTSSLNLNLSSRTDKQFSVDPLPEGTASAITARKLTSSIVMLFAVIVACGTIFWLWQRSQLSSTSASGPSTEVPSVAVKSDPPPVANTVSPPAAQPTITEVRQDTPVNPAPQVQERSTAPVEQAPATPNVQAPASPRINLAVIARERTWVRITVDGKVTVQRVLTRGDSAVGSAQDSARIQLGNAGGVDVHFNGTDIGSVGPRGHIRTVEFTPEKFTVIEPQKKQAAAHSPSTVTAFD